MLLHKEYVITSYSIHYTKLYEEVGVQEPAATVRLVAIGLVADDEEERRGVRRLENGLEAKRAAADHWVSGCAWPAHPTMESSSA